MSDAELVTVYLEEDSYGYSRALASPRQKIRGFSAVVPRELWEAHEKATAAQQEAEAELASAAYRAHQQA